MPFVSVKDKHEKHPVQIFYKDLGDGQPVVFSHGWPLSADAWEAPMKHMVDHGFRAVAHDRRSHGRSTQTAHGNDMDTYVADLHAVIQELDLKNIILVGHSTGGGEVAHYIGTYGSSNVAGAVLVGAVPPRMAKSEAYPKGLPLEVFDGIRKGVFDDRANFYEELTLPFFGYNREGAKVSVGVRKDFWRQGMMGGLIGHYECIKQFSEVDYGPDLDKIDVPVLWIHGDDDQIVPIDAAAREGIKRLKHGELKEYKGAPHGLVITRQDDFNADLLAFVQKHAK